MSVLSVSCCALLSAVCAFTLVSATGCSTDAQGIDDCRAIEQARCSAAKQCGLVSDVDACQRFYRDQCLHGLPVSPPGSVKVQACVATIRNAGLCVEQSGDTETLLRDCEPPVTEGARAVFTVCGLIKEPEKASECSFLTPGADGGVGGASNEGDSGSAAGEGGQGGSSGAEDG
jgi:hypothetical protein